MIKKLNMILKRLLSHLPTKLPVGMTAFDKFANDIIELSGPYADADSMKFAIASQIIHLDARRASVPKNLIVKSLRKSAANQVASQVFQDIKTKKDAELKQLQESQQQEQAAKESVKL